MILLVYTPLDGYAIVMDTLGNYMEYQILDVSAGIKLKCKIALGIK
jgi:hypothetical protein